jgi:hypothetical protein
MPIARCSLSSLSKSALFCLSDRARSVASQTVKILHNYHNSSWMGFVSLDHPSLKLPSPYHSWLKIYSSALSRMFR